MHRRIAYIVRSYLHFQADKGMKQKVLLKKEKKIIGVDYKYTNPSQSPAT